MWDKALHLLRQAAGEGVGLNLVSYNAAVSACERGLQWEFALLLLAEARTEVGVDTVVGY